MKRTLLFASALVSLSSFAFVPLAFATVSPTLSLTPTGNSDNVQVSVTADPNTSVLLSYTQIGAGPLITSLGTTDSNGSFSTIISTSGYNLTSGTPVTVVVGGTSGARSPTIAWPTVSASSNTLSLSQNAAVVNVGSSITLTANNLVGSSALYVSNNSNASIANVSINGTQVTLSGNISGSTSVTLCQVGNTTNCPMVYVTVEPSGAGQLSLSQNTVSVVTGQYVPVTISGGNGVYQILNNSNPNVIQVTITGSVLTFSTGASSGSASITVCSSDLLTCGVVVANAGSASSVAITLSNTAPVVSTNQNTTINIYGPTGLQFYVSSNSTPSVVQASVSGTVLTLTGISAGSSSLSICSTTNTCVPLTVTVQTAVTGGNIALSQNALSILSGQSMNITVSGGQPPYMVSGGNTAVAQETLTNGTLSVYGVATGSSAVNVCSSAGGCILLTITVNGGGGTTPVTTPIITPVPVVTPTVAQTTSAYTFTSYLAPGASGAEVSELQRVLVAQGILLAAPSGYYGDQTKAAVIKFQAAHGLDQLGVVGPATRVALNAIENASVSSGTSSTIATMSLSDLRTEVQLLQAQLTQVLNRIAQLTGQ